MTDGGYTKSAIKENNFVNAPGERAGILVDFSKFAPGTKIIMNNTANAPLPDGDPVDEHIGQIMQFTVKYHYGFRARYLPYLLTDTLKGSFFQPLKQMLQAAFYPSLKQ